VVIPGMLVPLVLAAGFVLRVVIVFSSERL
jgi:hypothetical protein